MLLGSAAVGAFATALTGGSATSVTGRTAISVASTGRSEAGQSLVEQAFGLVRGPVTPSDSLSSQLLARAGSQLAGAAWQERNGVDISQAHRSPLPDHEIWMIAGSPNTCVVAATPSGGIVASCADDLDFVTHGSVLALSNADGSTSVFGVLPDGVTKVQLVESGGASSPVTVADNAFWSDTAANPTALTYVGSDGQPQTLQLNPQ